MQTRSKPAMLMMAALVLPSVLFGLSAANPVADDTVTPGQFYIEPPTLIALGFEWYVEGDDNRNAVVKVMYRKKGDKEWQEALPLFRLKKEETIQWSQDRGGGLFIRSGGIIPHGPLMQYRRERPLDEMMLYVFPDIEESTMDLYEDDGVSLDHRKGKSA